MQGRKCDNLTSIKFKECMMKVNREVQNRLIMGKHCKEDFAYQNVTKTVRKNVTKKEKF